MGVKKQFMFGGFYFDVTGILGVSDGGWNVSEVRARVLFVLFLVNPLIYIYYI